MRGRNKDRRKDIIKGRAQLRGLNVGDLARKTGIPLSTLYRRLKRPGDITLEELSILDELIGFDDSEVLYFVRWRRCEK